MGKSGTGINGTRKTDRKKWQEKMELENMTGKLGKGKK